MRGPRVTFDSWQRHTASLPSSERLRRFQQQAKADQEEAWADLGARVKTERKARLNRARENEATRQAIDDAILEIDPPTYFSVLAGVEVPAAGGYVNCPLHEERSASCRAYPTAAKGFYCWGCLAGGDIYTLAGCLLEMETRGPDFPKVRDHIVRAFGLEGAR